MMTVTTSQHLPIMVFTLFRRNGQAVADCFICGKERHFYVDPKSGKWDCKSCGEKGNAATFLQRFHANQFDATKPADYRQLAKTRGLPPAVATIYRDEGLAKDNDRWLVPMRNKEGKVVNIGHKDSPGQPIKSTTGCKLHLYGEDRLAADTSGTIYVAEGPWDMVALMYLLSQNKVPGTVVAVPGSSTYKRGWMEWFKGKDAVLLYDNDQAGRAGSAKARTMLGPVARSIRWIDWPKKAGRMEAAPGGQVEQIRRERPAPRFLWEKKGSLDQLGEDATIGPRKRPQWAGNRITKSPGWGYTIASPMPTVYYREGEEGLSRPPPYVRRSPTYWKWSWAWRVPSTCPAILVG